MTTKFPDSFLPAPESAEAFVPDAALNAVIANIPALPPGAGGAERLADVFFALFAAWKPGVFCDIGANRGDTSIRAKLTCPNCTVHGFEANPEIHAEFAPQITGQGVQWHNKAVIEAGRTVTMHIPRVLSRAYYKGRIYEVNLPEDKLTGKGSILKRNEDAHYVEVDVQGVSLDGMFASDCAELMLWIDVEGGAPTVLAGASEVLARTLAIYIEVEGYPFWEEDVSAPKVIRTLRAQGFEPVLRDQEYNDAQFNLLFVRRDLHGRISLPALSRFVEQVGRGKDIGDVGPHVFGKTPLKLRKTEDADEVPVVIPCFENPSFCNMMLDQLEVRGVERIIFVDNASRSEPMNAFLDGLSGRAEIVRLNENLGPHLSVFKGEFYASLPQKFCVTDPDIAFNPMLPQQFIPMLDRLSQVHKIGKVGFALDISDRDHMIADRFDISGTKYHIWEWEAQFWQTPIGRTPGQDPVFRAGIDTTFALYDKARFDPMRNFIDALRVAGRFTARHLPWMLDQTMTSQEERHYREAQKFSSYLPAQGTGRD